MTKTDNISSRLLYLLLFIISIVFLTCKKNPENQIKKVTSKLLVKKNTNYSDSIAISVKISNMKTQINIRGYYLNYVSIQFNNPFKADSIITKKILKNHKNQILSYNFGFFDKNQKIHYFKHEYLIDDTIDELNFEFKEGDLLLEREGDVLVVDSISKEYEQLRIKIFKAKKQDKQFYKKKLNALYSTYEQTFLNSNQPALQGLNKMYYVAELQRFDTSDKRIGDYLKHPENHIIGNVYFSLIYEFIKHNVEKFKYDELNIQHYSSEYVHLISVGVFNFLKNKNNRGKLQFKNALNWLKETELYKNDSVNIKKAIEPLSNTKFKTKLKELVYLDTLLKKNSISKILKKHRSKYYLIDFWATWCAPCIGGIKAMQKMDFPKNVKILSLSVDKPKDSGKWQTTTKKLKQHITYWLNDKSKATQEFLKFIELNTIPRYILIDNNMNLIDQSFLPPHDPLFLPKLWDVKKSKFW